MTVSSSIGSMRKISSRSCQTTVCASAMQYAPEHLRTLLRAAPITLEQTAEPLNVEGWGWVQPSLDASDMYVRGSLSSDFASKTISGLPSLPCNKNR